MNRKHYYKIEFIDAYLVMWNKFQPLVITLYILGEQQNIEIDNLFINSDFSFEAPFEVPYIPWV